MLPKLIRDKISSIIVKDGKIPICEFVDDGNVEPYIFNKIREEVNELQCECNATDISKEKILEEFADVFEILLKLLNIYGIEAEDLAAAMREKRVRCGAFNDNIILTDVIEKG